VDLEDFQKPFFTVSGQAGKPGQHDLRTDTAVAEAESRRNTHACLFRY
jgi:hypothetical protein